MPNFPILCQIQCAYAGYLNAHQVLFERQIKEREAGKLAKKQGSTFPDPPPDIKPSFAVTATQQPASAKPGITPGGRRPFFRPQSFQTTASTTPDTPKSPENPPSPGAPPSPNAPPAEKPAPEQLSSALSINPEVGLQTVSARDEVHRRVSEKLVLPTEPVRLTAEASALFYEVMHEGKSVR